MTLSFRLTLSLIVVALAWLYDGPAGVLTLALHAIGVVPGLSLGFALFGRKQAAGWIAGTAIGYGLLAFAFWIPVATGHPGPAAFVFAWLMTLLLAGALAETGGDGPLVQLPEWTKRDSAALLVVLHLVPLVAGAPFARAERTGATVDVTGPEATTHPYFLPPAVFAARGSLRADVDVEGALEMNALLTSLLLVAAIYVAAWAATGRRWAAIAAAGISVLSPSFEGIYALRFHLARDQPLALLGETNIDAVSALGAYGLSGLGVDSLARTMWWAPQQAMACALGVIAVIAMSRWQGSRWQVYLFAGLVLALSVAINPLLGAMFCGVLALTAIADLLTGRMTRPMFGAALAAALPAGLALWWCVAAGMSAGAAGITFGLHPDAGATPFKVLFISLGGVLIPALLGLLPSRHVLFRPIVPALFALVLGLAVMHFVRVTEPSWAGLRAGSFILATIGMLVARGVVLTYHRSGRVLAIAFAAVIFLMGLPTAAIDWWNAYWRLP